MANKRTNAELKAQFTAAKDGVDWATFSRLDPVAAKSFELAAQYMNADPDLPDATFPPADEGAARPARAARSGRAAGAEPGAKFRRQR